MINNKNLKDLFTPKGEFKASMDFKDRVLRVAEAKNSEIVPTPNHGDFPWRILVSTVAAAAMFIAVILIAIPQKNIPAYAADDIFRSAEYYFNGNPDFCATYEQRTKDDDIFLYVDLNAPFVEHKITVESMRERWKIEKPGHTTAYDGKYTWDWYPKAEKGWKYEGEMDDESSLIIFNPAKQLKIYEYYCQENPETVIEKYEKRGIISLAFKTPYMGLFAEDWGDSTAAAEILHTMNFEKNTGRLLTSETTLIKGNNQVTYMRITDIDYSPDITPETFTAPRNIYWVDFTNEGYKKAISTLPVDRFEGLSCKETLIKMFDAMEEWNKDTLQVLLYQYDIDKLEKIYRGCTLLEVGDGYVKERGAERGGGLYGGLFFPCTILLADGTVKKLDIHMGRSYFHENSWIIHEQSQLL